MLSSDSLFRRFSTRLDSRAFSRISCRFQSTSLCVAASRRSALRLLTAPFVLFQACILTVGVGFMADRYGHRIMINCKHFRCVSRNVSSFIRSGIPSRRWSRIPHSRPQPQRLPLLLRDLFGIGWNLPPHSQHHRHPFG